MEAAENIMPDEKIGEVSELECIETPDCKTIEDVCKYLHSSVETSCKAVVYQRNSDDTFICSVCPW